MVNVSGARPHVLRVAAVVALVLTVFLFFDPVGFAPSSAVGAVKKLATPSTTHAVTHLVLFEFKKDVDAAKVSEMCAKMVALKEACVSPNSNHPYIQSIAGGRDISIEALQHGATHAFVVQFSNTDDRNYYVDHDPAHQAFKKEVGPLVEKVTVLDFANGSF
ncbi:hypothetical protein VTJ83DRAFT_1362 [Remersonia thermophila]|uniref:Stress-response A/B barrel domain-containing protein n=1 Tax=Remersonia thermophila TaxID=72144 RepID=A0ABR4DP63_9PEZI